MNEPEPRPPNERTDARRPAIDIPPEEAVALLMLVIDMGLAAWEKRKMSISSSMYRARQDLLFAMNHDHGLSKLVRQTAQRFRTTRRG
jgi:hypothetical protein